MQSTTWHLITSEYPPQPGGVSDYTQLVAAGLAAAGDEVHVWCPAISEATDAAENETEHVEGVSLHRVMGRFGTVDLRRAGNLLDQFGSPRRLLVQWVPHGYGYRSMNLPFCLWLWQRARKSRDNVELMVHEPFLAFGEGSVTQDAAAIVHRLMTMILLRAASRVWISIPAWETRYRPYTLGRRLSFRWLPVASNITVVDDPEGVRIIRAGYAPEGQKIVGHFGTYDRNIKEILLQSLPSLLRTSADCTVLLLGRGSEAMRDDLIRIHPELANRVHATGPLAEAKLSRHIKACDLMLQPYIDGASSRRTSLMVGLSHGMPIVTTSGRLTESLWFDSDAVALIPVEDMAALVTATKGLLSDETGRARLGVNAKALYHERFAVQRTLDALREVTA